MRYLIFLGMTTCLWACTPQEAPPRYQPHQIAVHCHLPDGRILTMPIDACQAQGGFAGPAR